jgi:2,4-dienoyl-CoA reductase-like NADH-dependent reductase (Old Yellow Enzyme family)
MQHAQMLVEAGVDAFSVSSGPFETHHKQFPGMYQQSGALVPLAAAIKKAAKAQVFAVGKIDAALGDRVLQDGSADFIEMCRALMADPDLPNKAREGDWKISVLASSAATVSRVALKVLAQIVP